MRIYMYVHVYTYMGTVYYMSLSACFVWNLSPLCTNFTNMFCFSMTCIFFLGLKPRICEENSDEMWVQVATQLTTHVHNYLVISFSEGQPGTMWSLFEGMENPRLSKPGEVGNKTHRHLQPVIRCRCQAMLMVALVACWTGHGMLVPCVVWMASWQTAEGICFEHIPCVRDKQVQLWHFLLTSPPFYIARLFEALGSLEISELQSKLDWTFSLKLKKHYHITASNACSNFDADDATLISW